MVTQAILDVVFKLVDGLLSKLPEINISVPANIVTNAAQFLNVAAYIIPMDTVKSVLTILIMLQFFRIVVSLIRTIWSLLPVV